MFRSQADFSGNLVLGDREDLLAGLSALDEDRSRIAQESARRLLEQARVLTRESVGIEAQTRLRHGGLRDTSLERGAAARLFVIGKRGEHADFSKGCLGSNLERCVRAVQRPQLIGARALAPAQEFLIVFDGGAATRRGSELIAMGAWGHSRIRRPILRSTTTQILRACHVPVLLLR